MVYLEHWWNDTAMRIRGTRRRASPTATLSTKYFTLSGPSPTATIFTTDLTWSVPGWNAGLRGEGRATDPFSYGTPIKHPSSSSGFYPLRSVWKRGNFCLCFYGSLDSRCFFRPQVRVYYSIPQKM
jgi:hypothetical protein